MLDQRKKALHPRESEALGSLTRTRSCQHHMFAEDFIPALHMHTADLHDLNFVPRTHMIEEENRLLQVVLSSTCMHKHRHKVHFN